MRALVLLSLLALAACGQKGNLYLPDEGAEPVEATITSVLTPPAPEPAAAPAPAPATDPDDDPDDDTQRN